MEQQHHHRMYPLTSLQIGDMQSYVSRLHLYLTCEISKLFILVDNGPWLLGNHCIPAQLWQLMVTKSRMSPFANTRTRPENEDLRTNVEQNTKAQTADKRYRRYRWLSAVNAARWQHKALAPVKELHHTLHGCVVFEVAWVDVRGINYTNELQTDTCLALEVKSVIKKEFDSIEQALGCINSQCNGTRSGFPLLAGASFNRLADAKMHGCQEPQCPCSFEVPLQSGNSQIALNPEDINVDLIPQKGHLRTGGSTFRGRNNDKVKERSCVSDCKSSGHDRQDNIFRSCQDVGNRMELLSESRGASASDKLSDVYGSKPQRERKSLSENSYFCCSNSLGPTKNEEPCVDKKYFRGIPENDKTCCGADAQLGLEAVVYKDVLIIFKFSNAWLPFELKQIITSDLRLLRLLESGLPSWVIFFQSYPIFCQLYCPWMCPLAKTLYILISVVTVLIGFYDLYKNVPVLKATAARICGPLFDWIEAWEMISRLKYLGTMLFLQNFEKAFKWSLTIVRGARQLTSLLTRPMVEPLEQLGEFILPFWSGCMVEAWDWMDAIWIVMSSLFCSAASFLQILIWPFVILLSLLWNLVTAIMYPIASVFWELLITPVRLVLMLLNCIALISSEIVDFGKRTWQTLSGTFQLISATEPVSNTNTASMWRALWNDLFSKVFRAIRSIVNGFAAFFIACNKHRLSIYNHLAAFFVRLCEIFHIHHFADLNTSGHILRAHEKAKLESQDRVDKEYMACKSLDYPNREAAKYHAD